MILEAAATEGSFPCFNSNILTCWESQAYQYWQSAAPPAIVASFLPLISMTFLTVSDETYAPMEALESTAMMIPPWNTKERVVVPKLFAPYQSWSSLFRSPFLQILWCDCKIHRDDRWEPPSTRSQTIRFQETGNQLLSRSRQIPTRKLDCTFKYFLNYDMIYAHNTHFDYLTLLLNNDKFHRNHFFFFLFFFLFLFFHSL